MGPATERSCLLQYWTAVVLSTPGARPSQPGHPDPVSRTLCTFPRSNNKGSLAPYSITVAHVHPFWLVTVPLG